MDKAEEIFAEGIEDRNVKTKACSSYLKVMTSLSGL